MTQQKVWGKPLGTEPKAPRQPLIKRKSEGMVALVNRWHRTSFPLGDMAQLAYGNDAVGAMEKIRAYLETIGHTGSVMLWEKTASSEDVAKLIKAVFR